MAYVSDGFREGSTPHVLRAVHFLAVLDSMALKLELAYSRMKSQCKLIK